MLLYRKSRKDRACAVNLRMKARKTMIRIFIILMLFIAGGGAVYLAALNPPRDNIKVTVFPPEFFCENSGNYIDVQTEGNCAAYAAAYVLRHLGEQTDGEKVSGEIKRVFGFVPAKSIVRIFQKHGFSAAAFHGNIDTLKQRLTDGVPVIVFVDIPNDTHYVAVVGYDGQYVYLADSLAENRNADEKQYNRKLTTEEFESIWKTDTPFSENIYIVVSMGKTNGKASAVFNRRNGIFVLK